MKAINISKQLKVFTVKNKTKLRTNKDFEVVLEFIKSTESLTELNLQNQPLTIEQTANLLRVLK